MPTTRVIKHRPAETKPKILPRRARADEASKLQPEEANCGKKRASSCPRCYHDTQSKPVTTEARGRALKCEIKEKPGPSSIKSAAGTKSLPVPRAQPKHHIKMQSSHEAFTVFAPNPKKREDIQKKAEAELAALENLRLSQAMSYVSILPSSVGGSLTLEEVRIKQQQEMEIKRREKQMKKHTFKEALPMISG